MVQLEFRLDRAVILEDRQAGDLREADSTALYTTYFVMPVRLRVGGVEMLELPNNPAMEEYLRRMPSPAWRELPLLNVATLGLHSVKEAAQKSTSRYKVPEGGYLYFTVTGGDALVSSSDLGQKVGHTPYDELLQAFEQFAMQVRDVLGQECPELKEHPSWGPWFRGQEVSPG